MINMTQSTDNQFNRTQTLVDSWNTLCNDQPGIQPRFN
jgi:hypothetical protein